MHNKTMTTLVSAFVSGVNSKYADGLQRYYQLGKLLLRSATPKIVFVDESMAALIGDDYDKATTVLLRADKSDVYLYARAGLLTRFELHTTDPSKDTAEFMLTICGKTEWVRKATALNAFRTEHFVWVDFGLRHVFRCTDESFVRHLDALQHRPPPAENIVRIAGIWDPEAAYAADPYKDVLWYFAGGVFGGRKDALLHFADATKAKCIEIMEEKNTLMWEVNVWYLLLKENKENKENKETFAFDIYRCDHNDSMLERY